MLKFRIKISEKLIHNINRRNKTKSVQKLGIWRLTHTLMLSSSGSQRTQRGLMQINIESNRKFRTPKIRPSRAPVHSQSVVIDSGRHSRNNGNGTVSKLGGRKIGRKITAGVNATAANGPAAACS